MAEKEVETNCWNSQSRNPFIEPSFHPSWNKNNKIVEDEDHQTVMNKEDYNILLLSLLL